MANVFFTHVSLFTNGGSVGRRRYSSWWFYYPENEQVNYTTSAVIEVANRIVVGL